MRGSHSPTKDDYVNLITTTYNLSGSAGFNQLSAAPFEFARVSYYDHSYGSISTGGSGGIYSYWWSRMADSTNRAYGLFSASGLGSSSGSANPQSTSDRGNGLAVRCLAK